MGKKRGSILFLAIGALSILSILAAGASFSVAQQWKLATFVSDANTSFYYALSVVRVMKAVWSSRDIPHAITLYDLRVREMPFEDRLAATEFVDEQSFVNVAHSPPGIILRLPGIYGNEDLARAVLATPLEVKEDLLLVEGMTPEIYEELKDFVTIYGSGRVNINTAQDEILKVLGMEQALVERIRDYRSGFDGEEGTQDDKVFTNPDKLDDVLVPYGLTNQEKELLEALVFAQVLTTGSSAIRCEINLTRGRRTLKNFTVIIDPLSGRIFRWDEE